MSSAQESHVDALARILVKLKARSVTRDRRRINNGVEWVLLLGLVEVISYVLGYVSRGSLRWHYDTFQSDTESAFNAMTGAEVVEYTEQLNRYIRDSRYEASAGVINGRHKFLLLKVSG